MADPNPKSILDSVKKLLGFDPDYEAFDMDILMHTNAIFSTLNQLGVGPKEAFSIEDNSSEWDEFTGGLKILNDVKTYMYFRLRLIFDPPTTSFGLTAIEKQVTELEWRLNVKDDHSYDR